MIPLSIFLRVKPNDCILGQMYIPIDNGIANSGVATNVDVREQDTLINFTIAIYSNIRRKYRVDHPAPADNTVAGNNGVECNAHPYSLLSKDKLCRRILTLIGTEGPGFIIEIELMRYGN